MCRGDAQKTALCKFYRGKFLRRLTHLEMVSVGELGTRMDHLEKSLSKILDIAHTWRAILLIDEADIFLEQRELHDINRNALVSIFLRKLEYFQGIVFLTTNRVETFDEAFQSRIHFGLRYDNLDIKSKKDIWKLWIKRARELSDVQIADITENDFTELAKCEVNGREVRALQFFSNYPFVFPCSTYRANPYSISDQEYGPHSAIHSPQRQ